MSNTTCPKEKAEDGPSLFQNGNLVFQAHHVGWIISGFFTIVATITSFWLVNKHLQWYTNKREQRYVVRILFMVPIYAIISFASYLFWNHSTPIILIRDCYESTVLTSFFYLLLVYISPDPNEQRAVYLKAGLSREADREARARGEQPKKWIFPLGFVKWKPSDGLYFLQLQKWGVLQYCVLRPLTTLAAVILDYAGLYCEASWGLGWGHIYLVIIVSLSVTIAMYCLIQLYVPVAQQLKPQKPLLKLFAVKAVVFLTFWQSTFLSVLAMFGLVKDTKYMTAEDINIGIGALLETFEMMLFAFLHVKAFTYKPYRPFHDPKSNDAPPQRTNRLRALGNVLDFRETFREISTGSVYIWDRLRGREPRPDFGARRLAHLEGAFGFSRPFTKPGMSGIEKEPIVEVQVDEVVDIDGERQWLGVNRDHPYTLGHVRGDKSEGLEVQVLKELERRRTESEDRKADATRERPLNNHPRKQSWWRSMIDRVSHSEDVDDHDPLPLPLDTLRASRPISKPRSRHASRDRDANRPLLPQDYTYEDPPPASLIRSYKDRRRSRSGGRVSFDLDPRPQAQPAFILEGLSTVIERPVTSNNSHPGSLLGSPELAQARSKGQHSLSQTSSSVPRGQYTTPTSQFARSDSVLGRVFPPSTGHGHESVIENSPPADAAHLPMTMPVSRKASSRSRSPTQAHLLPISPLIFDGGREISMAGERSTFQSLVSPEDDRTPNTRRPLFAEVVLPSADHHNDRSGIISDSAPGSNPGSHRRESACYAPRVESPPSSAGSPRSEADNHYQHWEQPRYSSPVSSPHTDSHLRRLSAQMNTPPSAAYRRPRRLTTPALLSSDLPAPQHSDGSRLRRPRHRTSAAQPASPSSRHHAERARHNADVNPLESAQTRTPESSSSPGYNRPRRSSQPIPHSDPKAESPRSPRTFMQSHHPSSLSYPYAAQEGILPPSSQSYPHQR